MPRLESQPDDRLILPCPDRYGVEHDYAIPPVEAEVWWKASALAEVVVLALMGVRHRQAEIDVVKAMTPEEQYRLVLSDGVVDRMRADGVPGEVMRRAFTAGLMWIASGGDEKKTRDVWLGKGPTLPAQSAAGRSKTSRRRS